MVNYGGYGYPMNYPNMQMQQQMQNASQMAQQVPQQMQNGGFVSVPNIDSARNYPVAPGSVVTFKIENQPIVCEKSQGFSQFESPHFSIYDLRKREEVVSQKEEVKESKEDEFISKEYFNPIIEEMKDEIESLKATVNTLQERNRKQSYISKSNHRRENEDDTK